MKALVLISSLLFSFGSFATSITFSYHGNEGSSQNFYACSYVEDQTESYLEQLGATGVQVSCHGGIQHHSMGPVRVRATFDLPVVTGSGVETVEFEGAAYNPACGLNTRIIKEILKAFSNVTVVKKSDACPFVTSNYYYKLEVAR